MYRAANDSKVKQGGFYFIQLFNIHVSLVCSVEGVAARFLVKFLLKQDQACAK